MLSAQNHVGHNCPAASSLLTFDLLRHTPAGGPGSAHLNQVLRSGSLCKTVHLVFLSLRTLELKETFSD